MNPFFHHLGDLMNTRQIVISDHMVELHLKMEQSDRFGDDVTCAATNSAGSDSVSKKIPCKLVQQ